LDRQRRPPKASALECANNNGGGSILLQLAGKSCDGAAGITDVVGWPVVAAEIAEALDRSLRKLEAKPLSSASHETYSLAPCIACGRQPSTRAAGVQGAQYRAARGFS